MILKLLRLIKILTARSAKILQDVAICPAGFLPVGPHNGGWAVLGAGNERATKTAETQSQAIEIAEISHQSKAPKCSFIDQTGRLGSETYMEMTLILLKNSYEVDRL